jgi:hypothetical protein
VSPGYLATLKIPLLAGRDFTDRDTRKSQRVAIINETFVGRFLAGGRAVERSFHAFGEEITIAGIARDSKYGSLAEPPMPLFLSSAFSVLFA